MTVQALIQIILSRGLLIALSYKRIVLFHQSFGLLNKRIERFYFDIVDRHLLVVLLDTTRRTKLRKLDSCRFESKLLLFEAIIVTIDLTLQCIELLIVTIEFGFRICKNRLILPGVAYNFYPVAKVLPIIRF